MSERAPFGQAAAETIGSYDREIESADEGFIDRGPVQRLVSRSGSMADQMLGAESDAIRLVQEGALPASVLERLRSITNNLSKTERAIYKAKSLPVWQDFAEKWLKVPPEWSRQVNRALEGISFDPPEGLFNGKTWQQYLDDVREIRGPSVAIYNEGARAQGLEGIDPDLGAVRPTVRRGTGVRLPFGRMLSSLFEVVPNTVGAATGASKNFITIKFSPAAREKLRVKMDEMIREGVQEVDGKFIMPRKWGQYLGTTDHGPLPEVNGKPITKIEEGPYKGGFLIGDEADFNDFLAKEPTRFVEQSRNFKNVTKADEWKIQDVMERYIRKLPFIDEFHTAGPLDFIEEARSLAMQGAAMKAQRVGLAEDLKALAGDVSRSAVQSDRLTDLRKALWGLSEKEVSETSLAFRAYQQLGRAGKRDNGFWARVQRAMEPAAYDISLNASPVAAVNQVFQNQAQAALLGHGMKHFKGTVKGSVLGSASTLADLAKRPVGWAWPDAGQALGEAANRWRVSADPMHTTTTSLGGGFAQGSALTDRVLRESLPELVGELVERPSGERILKRMFSDEEIQALREATDEGVTDLSDPEIADLAEGVFLRYAEASNGADINTSKPAFMQKVHPALRMFKQTPAQIAMASRNLFVPGGLLDQGSAAKNAANRVKMGYIVAGWLGSRIARSMPALKAGSLALGTASPVVAAFELARALSNGEHDSEKRTAEVNRALFDAILHSEDLRSRLKAVGIVLSSGLATSLIPGGSPDALLESAWLNDADRKMLKLPTSTTSKAADLAAALAPSAAIVGGLATGIPEAYLNSFQGDLEGGNKKFYVGGFAKQMLSGGSKIPLIREISPIPADRTFQIKGIKNPMEGIPKVRPVQTSGM